MSILLILAGHFAMGGHGWVASLGVETFFVLSGRLMADILFVERFPLREFYKRRISRIFPGLAAFAVLTYVCARDTEMGFKWPALATALSFTINYAMVVTHGVAAIENLWSLCIEEHAYVLLGLLALLSRRRHSSPVLVLLIISAASIADAVVSSLVLKQSYFTVYWRTDAHLASIFLSAAAYLFWRDRRVPAWTCIAAFGVGLACMAAGPDALRFSAGTLAFAIAINTLDQAPKWLRNMFSWRPMTAAGAWSFSVYLWQQPFFRLMVDGRLLMPVALTIACAVGVSSFYLIEQPARRWLNANWRLPKAKSAIAASRAA